VEMMLIVLFCLWLLVGLTAVILGGYAIYHAYRRYRRTNMPKENALHKFNVGDVSSQAQSMIALINCGFFTRTKLSNTGKRFPESRQCEDFMRSVNDPEIIATINEIGGSLGRIRL